MGISRRWASHDDPRRPQGNSRGSPPTDSGRGPIHPSGSLPWQDGNSSAKRRRENAAVDGPVATVAPGGTSLFPFFADRYKRKSICITTNLEFGRWSEVFGDATLTEALRDRLTHHAHILVFKGEFYRFAQRSTKKMIA
jgi:hypothetical protein